jgi:acyl-CoA synthetase (AMP-forming)/AMP-acid ligase II/aryl carrier-like protein
MSILNRTTTIAAAIFEGRSSSPHPAIVDRSGHPMSYAQTYASVQRLSEALAAAGIGERDRIATLQPRGAAGLIAFLSASTVGCCCPMNPSMRAEEYEAYYRMLKISAVLDGTRSAIAAEAAAKLDLPLISFIDNSGEISVSISRPRALGHDDTELPPGTALLMQTSGTTAKPKIIPLTHHNVLSAALGIVSWFDLTPDDVCLNPMPLHHMHGLVTACTASLLAGSAVCCLEAFKAPAFHEALGTLQPTWFTGSPTMHLALKNFYDRDQGRVPTTSLRFFRSSSAPLPASIIADLESLFSAPLMETYGLTETGSMVCANPLPPRERKVGSVGVAVGAEIKICNDEGRALPPRVPGEVVIRGPSVIRRYLSNDEANNTLFHDGWLRTGDIGFLDEDDYLFIVGRSKELIKRGGLSVYPDEVDNALVAHPSVAESASFSVPHPTLGEELVSAIVPVAGHAPLEHDLRDYLSGQLSTYKVPAAILVVPYLPKNESGKIMRREVPKHFQSAFEPRNEPPANELEQTLLQLWQETLARADFGIDDNLLLLGADPIRSGELAEQLRARTGLLLSVKDVLAKPTVRAMAIYLTGKE